MAHRTVVLPSGVDPRILRIDDGGLSPRGRLVAWLLATLLLLVGAGTLAAVGVTPVSGARSPGSLDRAGAPADGAGVAHPGAPAGRAGAAEASSAAPVAAEWDGPTVHLDWTGGTRTTVEADFVGDRLVSPGDHVHRTLHLRNDGPGDAVMSVALLVDQHVPAGAPNPELAQAVDLSWDVAGVAGKERYATLLAAGSPTVAEVEVPQGAAVPVQVGFSMPAEETGHRGGSVDSTVLGFQVQVTLQGDAGEPAPPAATPAPDPGGLARTGAWVLGLGAAAAGLLLLGLLLRGLARRRPAVCDVCHDDLVPEDGWSLHHPGDGSCPRAECARCRAAAPEGRPVGG